MLFAYQMAIVPRQFLELKLHSFQARNRETLQGAKFPDKILNRNGCFHRMHEFILNYLLGEEIMAIQIDSRNRPISFDDM